MPNLNSLNSPRIRTALIALTLALTATACGSQPPQTDPVPEPTDPASTDENTGTVDSWVLGGTNVGTPLSDVTLQEWIGLMEQNGVTTLSGGPDEAEWTGLGADGLTATAWSNESGALTEIGCSIGQAPSVEEALPTIDICLESLEADDFDPAAASDWLAGRAPALADQGQATLANHAFGSVGLLLMASTRGDDYSVSVMMRPTGE